MEKNVVRRMCEVYNDGAPDREVKNDTVRKKDVRKFGG